MPPHQIFIFIIGTVVVLFGAYYVTYFIGMKASGRTRAGLSNMRNRNIAVLDQFAIARDKSFCVVEVAGRVYVVGITANSMTLLDKYGLQEFEELTLQDGDDAQMPWRNTPVGQYGNKLTRKVVEYFGRRMGKLPQDNEEFGEDGIKKAKFSDSMKEAERREAEEANDKGTDTPEDD